MLSKLPDSVNLLLVLLVLAVLSLITKLLQLLRDMYIFGILFAIYISKTLNLPYKHSTPIKL